MPVFHLSITKPQQTVKISNHLIAQNFRLTKAVVVNRHTTTANKDHYIGNLELQIGGLMGNEFLSNTTNGRIPIPNQKHFVANHIISYDYDYDLSLKGENIPYTFDINVYGYKDLTDLEAGQVSLLPAKANGHFADTAGEGLPVIIDLYFEYETNHTFF
tara:strand:+ start:35 stop:511 length:477 start_codon:yes stop_codon:yes gene_type:complete